MDSKGKVRQIKFEIGVQRNNLTGEYEESPIAFNLWADKGLKELIKTISGVVQVTDNVNGYDTYYHFIIDPRYDAEFVKKEIEAVIICEIGEL